jgi:hypothetical protein
MGLLGGVKYGGETAYIMRVATQPVHLPPNPERLRVVLIRLDRLLHDVVDSDLDRASTTTFPLGLDLGAVVVVLLDSCGGGGDLDHDRGHGHLDLELDDIGDGVELHVDKGVGQAGVERGEDMKDELS